MKSQWEQGDDMSSRVAKGLFSLHREGHEGQKSIQVLSCRIICSGISSAVWPPRGDQERGITATYCRFRGGGWWWSLWAQLLWISLFKNDCAPLMLSC